MARYIDADKMLEEAKRISGPITGDGWDNYGVYALIERQPTANVVSRKHYLDALGTINEAHLYPERSAEIIDDFLKRHHTLCMEEPNDRT